MQQFGTFAPPGVSRIILGLARMGLGRGRLKLLFSQLWNQINGDKPVDLIYQNLKLRLHPRQNTIESKIMFSAKRREGAELELIKRHLADGGVFVDIGSNIGYYALNVALMSAGKVIAIEPNPPVLARLRDNIALNDLQSKITVHEAAIGATKDIAQLTISDNDFGSSSIVNQRVGKTHIDVEVLPLVEGGKGVAVSNGLTAGSWAASGGIGTFSGVNADNYRDDGTVIRQVYFGWAGSKYNTFGYLHWGLNQYKANPFKQSVVKHPSPQASSNNYLPAGDTHVIYPGKDGPLSSLRFEAHRKGIEDYELLEKLKLKNSNKHKRLIKKLFLNYTNYSLSINKYQRIRKKLLKSI